MSIADSNTNFLDPLFFSTVKYYYCNKLFLMVSSLVAFFALYLIHQMVDQPHIVSTKKVEAVALQFLFYGILLKLTYALCFYSLFSSLAFLLYFYWKAYKLETSDVCWDLLIIMFWFFLHFLFLQWSLFAIFFLVGQPCLFLLEVRKWT